MPATKRSSIVLRLQIGFAVASVVTIALLAAVLHGALGQALDREDEAVLQGQATALLDSLERGTTQADLLASRPEKAEWRLVDAQGHNLAQSSGMAHMPALKWPQPGEVPMEIESADGHPYTVLTVRRDGFHSLHLVMDRGHEQNLLSYYKTLLWFATCGAALLASWLGRVIAVRALAPLQEMERNALRFGPDALDFRLPHDGYPYELRALVLSLNQTFARIESAFNRLTTLGTDLAHELRTPLQNVRSVIEGLLLREADRAKTHDSLGEILEELDRLASMVEQMLFLARAEDPRTVVQRVPLPLRPELERAAAFFQAAAENDEMQIEIYADPAVEIWADRGLLQRAIHNLLANSLRHAPPQGKIQLVAGKEAQHVWLAVRDGGPGLPTALQARLGERFLRDDPSRARDSGGSGLGLAIVMSIMRMHGGALQVEAQGSPRLVFPISDSAA